jgi:hypothetical protein
MYICIGGDLDGEIVTDRKGLYFKASEISADKKSTYNRQTYIVGENTYRFWLCAELQFSETTKIVNGYLVKSIHIYHDLNFRKQKAHQIWWAFSCMVILCIKTLIMK